MTATGRVLRFLALALLLAAAPFAAADQAALKQGPAATVAEIVDGDTLILKDPAMGARQVRLVGIQAPKLPLGRPNFAAWPLAEESKKALAALALGQTLALSFGGAEMDRHGRLLAHLRRADGLWLQGEMLRLGMARVYSFPDNRALAAEMLTLERDARAAKRGIWGHPFYAVRTPAEAAKAIGTFQVVEGRVRKAAKAKGRIYLNFGDDWRRDFTVAIDAAAERLFKKDKIDPLALEGKPVRVRGWLKEQNGPLIVATHPEQIERLAP